MPDNKPKIILASQSPRRKQLLEWAEVKFEAVTSDADESFSTNMPVEEIPVFIARNKAKAVQQKLNSDAIILAADTIVVLDNKVINKPASRDEAIEMLRLLSGNEHRVITGVVLLRDNKEVSFADVTHVVFHKLTDEQIIFYVDKYKPYDKAGAYAIQEWIGVTGIKSINGDFYNVMGLPVSRVLQQLKHFTATL
ncbi:Maf family nucleotide pyrophosphatase [Parafilimonas terrae]|jgi:septum formation protein|uniref:dTTP/UTP pyrophosphatase n=1 Tax=Parafilimonas terrae TaxID=1465490 RepID=A0A1I5R922_9BACT|nr:Maf family nucleotide pyrophosphatase [Parafilimonas terrae]SFP54900.1 septum formation protein [Parafilimonas terrae]